VEGDVQAFLARSEAESSGSGTNGIDYSESRYDDNRFFKSIKLHLFKVDINGIIQNALTVSFVHHNQCVDLKNKEHSRNLR